MRVRYRHLTVNHGHALIRAEGDERLLGRQGYRCVHGLRVEGRRYFSLGERPCRCHMYRCVHNVLAALASTYQRTVQGPPAPPFKNRRRAAPASAQRRRQRALRVARGAHLAHALWSAHASWLPSWEDDFGQSELSEALALSTSRPALALLNCDIGLMLDRRRWSRRDSPKDSRWPCLAGQATVQDGTAMGGLDSDVS